MPASRRMETVTIRPAVAADCPQMLELIRELARYERQPDAGRVSMAELVDAGFGSHPVWEAFIAECDGRIVGISHCYFRYSTWKGRRLYLEDIVVTESMRGRGIGTMLFDQTLALCKTRGYHGMVWQVLDWNTPAIEFYEKYGASFDGEWLNASIETSQ